MNNQSIIILLAAGALVAGSVAVAMAPRAAAQSAAPMPTWTLATNASGSSPQAWRLNTRTGELDLCTISIQASGWVCFKMPEPNSN